MATVRSIEVKVCGRRSVDYQSNEVNVTAVVDLDAGDNSDDAIAKCYGNLQRHVDQALEEWGVPQAPKAKPPARPTPPPWQPPQQQLPRCPDGSINNCALNNGDREGNCQMCGGKCPDKHKYQ